MILAHNTASLYIHVRSRRGMCSCFPCAVFLIFNSRCMLAIRRVKVLKRHAQAAITLAPSSHARSYAVDDLAGATIAGLAMGFALVTLYLAQRSSAQFGVLYVMIYILGYMAKVPCWCFLCVRCRSSSPVLSCCAS